MSAAPRWVLFDWGGTLMSEDGPLDLPMALWPEVHAVEGAHEALATLAARYRIGVATNASVSPRNMIEVALGRVGLRDWVQEVFCYADIGARKDEDAFWRAVLERTGAEPADVVMIGDSLAADVLAPRQFGIASIWFNEGGRQAPDARGVPVIERLADAPAAVARAFAAAQSAPVPRRQAPGQR
ncbi:MAG TPA: HAD family hydrolase [Usitatibacter sp.]|nr:HAD family hydrolase [Usitatibacter sp.]